MDMKHILQAMDGVTNKPVEGAESMDKFLSIVKKNDVSILNEGANPHKVALPVQMAMQHYQQAESTTTASNESSMFKKYFHEVESEVNEQAQAKRRVVNQYASVIAERVMKKQSKNTILNEEESEEANERRRYPHYYKHKDKTVFRVGDSTAPNGYSSQRPLPPSCALIATVSPRRASLVRTARLPHQILHYVSLPQFHH